MSGRFRLLAATCAAACAAALACSETPERAPRTNPLDPAAGESPDPLALRTALIGTGVNLFWSAVPIEGIAEHRAYRMGPADATFAFLGSAGARALSYRDEAPLRDATAVYRVTLRNAAGEESALDAFAADTIDVPPILVIGTEDAPVETLTTRNVHISFYSDRAESVYLADSIAAISAGQSELVGALAFAPSREGYDIVLDEGVSETGVRTVFGRVLRSDGTRSTITFDVVRVRTPEITIIADGDREGPLLTGRRVVDVRLEASAADSLELTFALQFSGEWTPFSDARVESLPAPGRSVLRARVKSAVGAVASDTIAIDADTLGAVRLVLDGDAAQTTACAATLEFRGGAVLEYCLSWNPLGSPEDLPCSEFTPYTGPVNAVPLPPCRGDATLYALVANAWLPDGAAVPVSDAIYVVGGEPRIRFSTPAADGADTLRIGDVAELSGEAFASVCRDSVTDVRLSVRWIALADPQAPLPADTLLLGSAPYLGDDPGAVVWFFDWTPSSELPAGRIELIGRVASGDCVGGGSVEATLAPPASAPPGPAPAAARLEGTRR